MTRNDTIFETAVSHVQKFEGDITWEWDGDLLVPVKAGEIAEPYDVVEKEHNALFYGGSSALWRCLTGNGTATAGSVDTFFNNANAALGVGDSTTANTLTGNDLLAATNKLRVGMDATYPTIAAAGTALSNRDLAFRSTFSTSQANWAWEEWGVFNSPTAATGRMLNRVNAAALGTKTSAATWVLTVTLTLS